MNPYLFVHIDGRRGTGRNIDDAIAGVIGDKAMAELYLKKEEILEELYEYGQIDIVNIGTLYNQQ